MFFRADCFNFALTKKSRRVFGHLRNNFVNCCDDKYRCFRLFVSCIESRQLKICLHIKQHRLACFIRVGSHDPFFGSNYSSGFVSAHRNFDSRH